MRGVVALDALESAIFSRDQAAVALRAADVLVHRRTSITVAVLL